MSNNKKIFVMSFDKFQLRKDIFDFLTANLTDCEIVPEHPIGTGATKPKVVISLVRDQATGQNFITDLLTNPEIQITCYTLKELELTKPNTGLLSRIETLMQQYVASWQYVNFQKIKDNYIGYVADLQLHCNYIIYRFYGGNIS
jgi:hypothetical protein